jgi:phage shock protein A
MASGYSADEVMGALLTLQEATANGFTRVERTLDEHSAILNRQERRLDSIDRRLDRMDSRFDAMDSRFDAFERHLDARFESIDRKLDRLLPPAV